MKHNFPIYSDRNLINESTKYCVIFVFLDILYVIFRKLDPELYTMNL